MVRHLRITVVGAVLLVVAAAASTGAWVGNAEKTTYLTFNQVGNQRGAIIAAILVEGDVNCSRRDQCSS